MMVKERIKTVLNSFQKGIESVWEWFFRFDQWDQKWVQKWNRILNRST